MCLQIPALTNIGCDDTHFYTSVIVLCAGGTINMSGVTECKPSDGVNTVLQRIQKKLLLNGITVIEESIFQRPPDSSNVGEAEWGVICDRIQSIANRKKQIKTKLLSNGVCLEQGGIVIAHGTDTLHITSLVTALELSIDPPQLPVVFTASHSTLDAKGSDAVSNLMKSIYIAKEHFCGTPILPPGVYVLIGQDIHLASRLTKVSTMPNDEGKYFYSFPSPVGHITSAKNELFRYKLESQYLAELVKSEHVYGKDFCLLKPWGLVEHIYLDKFASLSVLEDLNLRVSYYQSQSDTSKRQIGIVIQGDFKGNPHIQEIANILQQIENKNVFILIGSKQTYEVLTHLSEYQWLSLIPKSMSHLKAKIKLGWLLKSNLKPCEIIKLMNTNLVGEIFQTDILPEWINFETFHSYNDYTEVVIAYPNISPKVLNDAMNRLMAAKNPQLFIYGFGDGHYPTSNLPISTLTSNYVFQKGWTQSELRFKDSSIEGITKDLCLLLADVDKKEQIASYFDINYKLLSNNISPQIRGLIEKDLINQKMSCQLSSDKIIGLFPSVDGMKIELSESALSDIHAYIMGKLKISLDDTVIDSNLQVLHNQYPNDRLVKWVFLFLADRCPEIIARRIMKDAIMASHLNMNIIGAATDRGVKIHVKTLAVKSKTDVSRYEAGNMLMLLGVDSDIRKGFPNPFFVPKYPMQNRL